MTLLTEKIYYADQDIFAIIKADFDLIDDKNWYQLFQNKVDATFWRLDKWDKYQEQIFVRLDFKVNWTDFDDKELRIELLLKTRGISDKKCIWNNCNKPTLQGLVFCERHSYEEAGIRR